MGCDQRACFVFRGSEATPACQDPPGPDAPDRQGRCDCHSSERQGLHSKCPSDQRSGAHHRRCAHATIEEHCRTRISRLWSPRSKLATSSLHSRALVPSLSSLLPTTPSLHCPRRSWPPCSSLRTSRILIPSSSTM